MNWLDHVQNRLLEIQPASVYALDERALELVSRLLPKIPLNTQSKPSNTPCSIALGIQALSGLTAQSAQHLISQTRLYLAPRLLLVEHADAALNAEAFRALGFTLSTHDAAENLNVYDYDLDTYKTVPDWLNARFWAHPERWTP